MVNYSTILGFAGLAPTLQYPQVKFPEAANCGEINLFYTGYTAYHPYVTSQGYNPVLIDKSLKMGAVELVKAGFNVRIVWQGPEEPLSNLEDRIRGTEWHVNSIGWGIRGHRNSTSTARFEDIEILFRNTMPTAPTVFNWGPEGFSEAIIRRIPMKDDCTNKPGKLLGYEEICDSGLCPVTTIVLENNIEKLLSGL